MVNEVEINMDSLKKTVMGYSKESVYEYIAEMVEKFNMDFEHLEKKHKMVKEELEMKIAKLEKDKERLEEDKILLEQGKRELEYDNHELVKTQNQITDVFTDIKVYAATLKEKANQDYELEKSKMDKQTSDEKEKLMTLSVEVKKLQIAVLQALENIQEDLNKQQEFINITEPGIMRSIKDVKND